MKHTLPSSDWAKTLAETIKNAAPRDVIEVDSMAKLELAARAAARLGRNDITLRLSPRNYEAGVFKP